jgi:hypothetical protein
MRAAVRLQLGTDWISSLQVHENNPLNIAVSSTSADEPENNNNNGNDQQDVN